MPKAEIYAIEDHDFKVICKASDPIKHCAFQFENSTIKVPDGFKNIYKFSYVGAGFESGECGIEIEGKRNMEGKVSCGVQLRDDNQSLTAHGKIIMDRPIGKAILVSNSNDGYRTLQFNEGQSLQFGCRAESGKYPNAKLLLGKKIITPNAD
jgi:phage-related tail fiber protein